MCGQETDRTTIGAFFARASSQPTSTGGMLAAHDNRPGVLLPTSKLLHQRPGDPGAAGTTRWIVAELRSVCVAVQSPGGSTVRLRSISPAMANVLPRGNE